MPTLEEGFKKTITSFKNRLTHGELQQVECNSFAELQVVINRIQRYQRDQKQMMNLTRIQSFLEAMGQFEQVIKVFLNVNDFVAFIWGPIKFLLQVASTWADAFDTLLDAYEQIGEHIPLVLQYQTLFEKSPQMQKVLNLMYGDIMDFHQRAIRFFADRVWKQIFKSAWKTFKTRFDHILDALARHKQHIESQATILHFQQYQDDRAPIKGGLEDTRHIELMRNRESFETMENIQLRKISSEVSQWLCSTDNDAIHKTACEARRSCPDSGKWVLRQLKVQIWQSTEASSNSVLWLNGIPGAGKSVLASVIIEDCRTRGDHITAYFYCTGNDSQKNTSIAVLRSIISQLLARCDALLPYCHDKFSTSGDTMLSSMHTARQLLDLLCEKLPKIFLVVDGLDECSETERRVLLNYLTGLVDSTPGSLRLLVVSQAEGDIKKLLSAAETLPITFEHNADDIRTFVGFRMVEIAKTFELKEVEAEEVAKRTCAGAFGMFLFAKLVMDNLLAQPTKEDFRAELSHRIFPDNLRSAYERIISRIKSRTKDQQAKWEAAVKLLGWMTCAKRPLRWHEIQAVQCIDSVAQELRFDDKKFRFDVQDLCGSLIIELPGKRLALVHSTAKQYILATKFISHFQVECHLTTLCLEYLIFPAFHTAQSEEAFEELAERGQLAFHDYSATNWTHHIHALAAAGKECSTGNNAVFEDPGQEDGLGNALDDFMYHYADDFQYQQIDSLADDACSAFAALRCYENLQVLWSHSNGHSTADLETRNKISLPTLRDTLERSRSLLEKIGSVKQGERRTDEHLDKFYGKNRFKCPKVTCFWFHEGFADDKARKTHVSRHDRPFRCEVADCSAQDYGLKTAKDLEKHTKLFHPTLDQQAVVLFTSIKTTPTKTPFACHLCPKRFTRKFHLASHILNHKQEKPFPCSECGKAFTRANDCKRHQKIHLSRG